MPCKILQHRLRTTLSLSPVIVAHFCLIFDALEVVDLTDNATRVASGKNPSGTPRVTTLPAAMSVLYGFCGTELNIELSSDNLARHSLG
jgi:hypothetical protein